MGRLIKYELKKQQTSRNIILALLLVFLLAFAAGIFSDNGNMVGISMGLEIFVGMFVFFYMGIESLLILNRDLKTKQSHMLWMVPMPSWKILGAKYIAAALQVFCISAAYVLAGTACVMTMIAKEGAWKELMQAIRMGFEWLLQGNLDWITVLAIIVSRTVLINSRFAGIVSLILFFVINGIVEYVYNLFARYEVLGIHKGLYIGIAEYGFYLVVCVGLFAISSVLAEKKLSV